jgi:Putative cyclase
MSNSVATDLPDWIRALAAKRRWGNDDRRGTANFITAEARARGSERIQSGETVSLARPLRGGDFNSTDDRPGFSQETWYVPVEDGTGWAFNHFILDPHGLQNTHLDGLNHVAVDGTFYGGRPVQLDEHGSIDVLAGSGLLTRAIYVDIPLFRGTRWADTPVEGADIDAALKQANVIVESGDALLVDMGRDRFEAERGHILGQAGTATHSGGGLGSTGARWVADHEISILAWDMLDGHDAKKSHGSAHILTWAIGLLLVDNCDFAALRRLIGPETQVAGALVLAPLAVENANGMNCNPLVIR